MTNHKANLHCISFGSSEEYARLSHSVLSEIKLVYPNIVCTTYRPNDLPEKLRESCTHYKRGFGYWAWKPYIVKRHLKSLNDGDILLYVDGRCGLESTNDRIGWLDHFKKNTSSDIAAWQLPLPEENWTSEDIFQLMHQSGNKKLRLSGQYASGIHLWRNGSRCRKLARLWEHFINTYPTFFMDGPFKEENAPNFEENRHDQSLFSTLIKILNQKSLISVQTIDMHQYSTGNLIAHMSNHPKTSSK